MGFEDILRAGQAIQATALVGSSLSLAKKRKKRARDFIGTGATLLVGTAIIKAESDLF